MADRINEFLKEFVAARGELLAFSLALVQSRADAENVFQEASLTLWEKFGEFESGTNFRAWARRVIYNKVLNERSRRRREISCEPEVFAALCVAFDRRPPTEGEEQLRDALAACVERLPPGQRQLVSDHYYEGKTYVQIAAATGRNEQGLRVALHRVRRALADCVTRRLKEAMA